MNVPDKALGFRDKRWVIVAVAAQTQDGQCCALGSFDDHEFVLSRGESWDETQCAVLKHADLMPMSREELTGFGALDAPSVDEFVAAFSAKVASRRNTARPAVWYG
jgi:hypothetical protein